MNPQDLVVGRLYKVVSKKSILGPEKEENLYMFLRLKGKKAYMLSLEGEYKKIDIEDIGTPRADYLEIFSAEVKENLFPLMRKFVLEYQKYDNIKYSKNSGFKSCNAHLKTLNELQRDIEKFGITPFITKAVDNYFNVYKNLNTSFNCVESMMINFLFISEWEKSHKKLRGFNFNSKKFADAKLDKFSQDTLILQHLYTNICLKPNFKNIKAEWIDLLITKIYYNGYKDTNKNDVIKLLSEIKEKCNGRNEEAPTTKKVETSLPKKAKTLNTISFADLIKENQYKINTNA